MLVDRGLARHIGISNMTIPKMELLLRDARIKPVVNEMGLHPHFQQPEFFRYLVEPGIQAVAYSPLGLALKKIDPHLTEFPFWFRPQR